MHENSAMDLSESGKSSAPMAAEGAKDHCIRFKSLGRPPHDFHGEHFAIALDGPGTSLTEQLSLPMIIYKEVKYKNTPLQKGRFTAEATEHA